MERTKRCTNCGRTLPLKAFNKHRYSHDGHAWQCRECNANRSKIWRKTPSAVYTNIIGKSNFYKRTNSCMYKPVIISKEEFIEWYKKQERRCVYCDLEEKNLKYLNGPLRKRAMRLTIDCANNDIGYVSGNLVLACDLCNYVKGNVFSFDEMREIGQKYLKKKWVKELSEAK